MKKIRNTVLLVLCTAMLVCASVVGTLAYLQDSKTVTNTMTVGKVEITLDETKVDVYGDPVDDAERVTENSYKLIPGHTYTKDPVIHVTAGSEACYVFVEVVNEIADVEGGVKIAEQLADNGWGQLATDSDVWYKAAAVDARENAVDVEVFTSFTIDGTADVSTCAGKTITVTAYAVQADGFDKAEEAWAASFGASNP